MNRAGIPKSWPTLLGLTNLLISQNDVLGELAGWAVRQSPYTVPENLSGAILAFSTHWPAAACNFGTDATIPDFPSHRFADMRALERAIDHVIEQVPEILAWNQRKNGRDGPAFVSHYSQPHPDNDFIDLGALSRNIAMSLWHAAADDKDFNDDFNERHNKSALPQTAG